MKKKIGIVGSEDFVFKIDARIAGLMAEHPDILAQVEKPKEFNKIPPLTETRKERRRRMFKQQ